MGTPEKQRPSPTRSSNGSMQRATSSLPASRGYRLRRMIVACIMCMVAVVGCAAPMRMFEPEQNPDALSDTAFLHYLPTAPVASVDEGFRAILLLADENLTCSTFEQRRIELIRRGAIGASWDVKPDQVLDKGFLAHMLVALCDMPRSLGGRLFSPIGSCARRYALKTCHREGLMPYGLSYEAVTGGELLGAVSRAETYVESRSAPQP